MNTSLEGKTILIVDDEADLREVLCDELKSNGCNVIEAENGTKAFELISKQKIRIDAIITDIRMPGGSGIDLLDKVKNDYGEQPAVFLITGFSDITSEDAYDKGAEAVLSKPCDLDDLVARITKALTPLNERWGDRLETINVKVNIELKFASSPTAIQSSYLSIGRGGMFIKLDSNFPKQDEKLEFRVSFSDGMFSPIVGTGICRWIRAYSTADYSKGIGIEFEHLTPDSSSNLIALLVKLRRMAFIPKK